MASSTHHLKLSCNYNGLKAIIILLYISLKVTFITCSHSKNHEEFIKTSCGVTIYTKLCFETLSPYANSIHSKPVALANVALSVSLNGAQSSLNRISRLSRGKHLSDGESHAIYDCMENLKDSVNELQGCLDEMKGVLEGKDFEKKMDNVMTWVSAALTDEDTCMDGFEGNDDTNGKIKSIIRDDIVNVAELTSNALAIIKNISYN